MADSDRLTVDNELWIPRIDADKHVLVCILVNQSDQLSDAGGLSRSLSQFLSYFISFGCVFSLKLSRWYALSTLLAFCTLSARCSRSARNFIGEDACSELELLYSEVRCGIEGLANLIPALAALSKDCHAAMVVKSGDLA